MEYKNMLEFFKKYDELKRLYPILFLRIVQNRYTMKWVIHVMCRRFDSQDDSELVFAESGDREEAFAQANKMMQYVEEQIINLWEYKNGGKRL